MVSRGSRRVVGQTRPRVTLKPDLAPEGVGKTGEGLRKIVDSRDVTGKGKRLILFSFSKRETDNEADWGDLGG